MDSKSAEQSGGCGRQDRRERGRDGSERVGGKVVTDKRTRKQCELPPNDDGVIADETRRLMGGKSENRTSLERRKGKHIIGGWRGLSFGCQESETEINVNRNGLLHHPLSVRKGHSRSTKRVRAAEP
jgi:hypothetical protein